MPTRRLRLSEDDVEAVREYAKLLREWGLPWREALRTAREAWVEELEDEEAIEGLADLL